MRLPSGSLGKVARDQSLVHDHDLARFSTIGGVEVSPAQQRDTNGLEKFRRSEVRACVVLVGRIDRAALHHKAGVFVIAGPGDIRACAD
jgi:hypothetical protein